MGWTTSMPFRIFPTYGEVHIEFRWTYIIHGETEMSLDLFFFPVHTYSNTCCWPQKIETSSHIHRFNDLAYFKRSMRVVDCSIFELPILISRCSWSGLCSLTAGTSNWGCTCWIHFVGNIFSISSFLNSFVIGTALVAGDWIGRTSTDVVLVLCFVIFICLEWSSTWIQI